VPNERVVVADEDAKWLHAISVQIVEGPVFFLVDSEMLGEGIRSTGDLLSKLTGASA